MTDPMKAQAVSRARREAEAAAAPRGLDRGARAEPDVTRERTR